MINMNIKQCIYLKYINRNCLSFNKIRPMMEWCLGNELFVGDFNGDGRDDILCHRISDGYKWISHANPNGTFSQTTW